MPERFIAVICLRWFHESPPPHSSPMRARFWMSFVDAKSFQSFFIVTAILCVLSGYIWPRYMVKYIVYGLIHLHMTINSQQTDNSLMTKCVYLIFNSCIAYHKYGQNTYIRRSLSAYTTEQATINDGSVYRLTHVSLLLTDERTANAKMRLTFARSLLPQWALE